MFIDSSELNMFKPNPDQRRKTRRPIRVYIVYLHLEISAGSKADLFKLFASRKHAYIILTPLNPTFI